MQANVSAGVFEDYSADTFFIVAVQVMSTTPFWSLNNVFVLGLTSTNIPTLYQELILGVNAIKHKNMWKCC